MRFKIFKDEPRRLTQKNPHLFPAAQTRQYSKAAICKICTRTPETMNALQLKKPIFCPGSGAALITEGRTGGLFSAAAAQTYNDGAARRTNKIKKELVL